ncbi:MAG TPA: hypothetical protein VM325_09295 [Alphaproteobacteria bacterium]|nr:hypothetical protein [Alphaproteobacteria bacterium]
MRAGLGVTARGERALEPGLAQVAANHALPPLPELVITLARAPGAPPAPAIDRLAAILEEMFVAGGKSMANRHAVAVAADI